MFLFFYCNIRSERELMETIPERIDWLWFFGYNLDSDIPNHSVLSKARKRWGQDVFRQFFERIKKVLLMEQIYSWTQALSMQMPHIK